MFNSGKLLPAGIFLSGIILAFIPVAGELHFLSAAIIGFMGSVIGAWRASRSASPDFRELLATVLIVLLAALPLLIRALFTGCLSFDGIAFWIFIPPFSTALGYAAGRYFRQISRYPFSLSVGLIIFFSGIVLLAELYILPQVYFFNHIWGYWPGPLYDDEVVFNPSLIFFRLITGAWTGLFWVMANPPTKPGTTLSLLFALMLITGYMNLSRAGIISTAEEISQRLGTVVTKDNLTIHADSRIPERELNRQILLYRFHLAEISDTLQTEPDDVHVFLYRHAWQKKRLTGAGHTSYVPVWNRMGQMHVHQPVSERIARHEMVHVVSREFGLPLLNASLSPGWVEGLAVALETPGSRTSMPDQIVAAADEWPDATFMRRLMSPTGFYRESGPLSYALAGSFTGWLLREFPVSNFKALYGGSSLENAYESDWETLVDGWHEWLKTVPVDERDREVSAQVFAALSVFDKKCPLRMHPVSKKLDDVRLALAEQNEAVALEILENLLQENHLTEFWISRWTVLQLRSGNAEKVAEYLESLEDKSNSLKSLECDARRMAESEHSDPVICDEIEEGWLRDVRSEELWMHTISISYDENLPDLENIPQKLWPAWLQRFSSMNKDILPPQAVELILAEQYPYYRYEHFGIFSWWITELISAGEFESAGEWISLLRNQETRLARLERLNELERLLRFAKFNQS